MKTMLLSGQLIESLGGMPFSTRLHLSPKVSLPKSMAAFLIAIVSNLSMAKRRYYDYRASPQTKYTSYALVVGMVPEYAL